MQQIWVLIRRDLVLELRTRYAISGILLYVLATVFIVYMALGQLSTPLWNAVFWVIVLFAAVSAVVKSFVQENSARQLYYYSLFHPVALLIAKVIYNTGLLFVLSLLSWGLMGWLTGNPVERAGLFVLILFVGSLGLSITMTFVSAISAKTGNSATLLAVLGFPLLIPILLILVQLSANAVGLMAESDLSGNFLILMGINMICLAVAIILYPFLWRE